MGGDVAYGVGDATQRVITPPDVVGHAAEHVQQTTPCGVVHAHGHALQVPDLVDNGLTRPVDFQVQRGVLVGTCEVGDDPSELVGIEFRGGELGHLLHPVCVAAEDLDAETVCPVRTAVGRVCPDDVVGVVYRLFPDLEDTQPLCALEHLRVLEERTEGIAVVVRHKQLGSLGCFCAPGGGEERGACHHEGIVLRGWELLVHERLVLDALVHLPAPPGHLPGVDLKVVQALDVLVPLLLLWSQLAVPVHLVDVALGVHAVELVTPPAAEDRTLRLGPLRGLVHIVEHIEPTGCGLKQVQPVRIVLG